MYQQHGYDSHKSMTLQLVTQTWSILLHCSWQMWELH